MDVKSCICTFRLQAAKKEKRKKRIKSYLIIKTCHGLICTILQRAGGFGLDKHLFLTRLENMNLSEMTPFYQTMFHMKDVLKVDTDIVSWGFYVKLGHPG